MGYATSTAFVQGRADYDANLQGSQFTGNGNTQNLKNAILTGKPYPIKMLFIQGETPLASSPPASGPGGWKQCYTSSNLDLIVFAGIWYEEDCDYADVILPEAQAMERPMGYNGFSTFTVDNPDNVHQEFSFLAAANQVVQPAGDVQDCTQYMTTIANLAGFGQYFAFKFDDFLNFELSPMGITIQQLKTVRRVLSHPYCDKAGHLRQNDFLVCSRRIGTTQLVLHSNGNSVPKRHEWFNDISVLRHCK